MVICLCNGFCLCFFTDCTGVGLLSCILAGCFFCYNTFIPHMLHMISLCQFIRICSKRIICTVMIFLPGAPLNLRQSVCSICCIKVSCSTLILVCLTACIDKFNTTDTFCSTAIIVKCIACNIIKLIQTSVIADDSTNVRSICCTYLTGKCIVLKGILIPCLCYHDISAKNTSDIVCSDNCTG